MQMFFNILEGKERVVYRIYGWKKYK